MLFLLGSTDRHEGSSKLSRVKGYDRDGERKRRPHSNEREERGREHYERYPDHGEYSDKGRHNQSYKTEYPLPQKFYKPVSLAHRLYLCKIRCK